VVVVTHNERLAAACDRTLRLDAGVLRPVPTLADAGPPQAL
jgi:predicted ABC-type transport system involved in lysophospholipase L1 biosynthesis ATPase subunit